MQAELAGCSVYKPEKHDLSKYLMEPKMDGFRAKVVVFLDGQITILSRADKPLHQKVPPLTKALSNLPPGTVLDGEFVYFDDIAVAPDFNMTARIMGSSPGEAIAKQETYGYVSLVLFDVLYAWGFDKRPMQYEIRRNTLTNLVERLREANVPNNDLITVITNRDATPTNHQWHTQQTGEGSVLKLRHGAYGEGWLKWKACYDADVVVVGFTPGLGKFWGKIGAIQFAQYKRAFDGKLVLTDRGQCSGMDDAMRDEISKNERKYLGKVFTIQHSGIAAGGGFRHPRFIRFRDDKPAKQCLWDEA